MAARLVDELPEGDDWIYEVKFDGYRALLLKNDGKIQIRSRNNKDMTTVYPSIATAGTQLNAVRATLDGEVVAVDASGRPSFQALQHRSSHPGHRIAFYAFDLLHLDGRDLTGSTLSERRHHLRHVIDRSGVLLSSELPGTANDVVAAVRCLGLEGVIAKRKDSHYIPGERSDAWRKLKLDKQQEFVVGGYRPGNAGVDALLVGCYQNDELRFAGKVRAGFTPRVRREVLTRLQPLHSPVCPFVDLPNSKTSHWGGGVTIEQMQEMQWTRPNLAAQVRFVEWTADGHLRHAVFLGLRMDKKAGTIRRET